MNRAIMLFLVSAMTLGCPEPDGTDAADSHTPGESPAPDNQKSESDMTHEPDAAGCQGDAVDLSGDEWRGWGNVQHPHELRVQAGHLSDWVYGQVWQEGVTDQPGAADGWEVQVAVGPLGTHPVDNPECWQYFPAQFNVDVENNDEYKAQIKIDTPGIYGMFFRYRPPQGAWRYGGLEGSDFGIRPDDAAKLIVETPGFAPGDSLVAVTLNLMCRAENWDARKELVFDALVREKPTLIGFQEDCLDQNSLSQASELRQLLATHFEQGYDMVHQVTHQGTFDGQTFMEGISVLSALPIDELRIHALPYVNFQRQLIAVDVQANGQPLRFYNSHFDNGRDNYEIRAASAEFLVNDLPDHGFAIALGDFNSTPTSLAISTLSESMTDIWKKIHPNNAGLTMPAPAPTIRLDYIFATDLLSSRANEAWILDNHNGNLWLSDHRGVAASFQWP